MPTPPKSTSVPPATRRAFCASATASLFLAHTGRLIASPGKPPKPPRTEPAASAQDAAASAAATSRPDVAEVDHDRILAAAARYLTLAPTPLTTLRCVRSPGTPHDYYSEALPEAEPSAAAPSGPNLPAPFLAHRDALFTLGLAVSALTAAYVLTADRRYAAQAALHIRAWFVDPATRVEPSLNYAHTLIAEPGRLGRPEGILETLPLVEIAQAIPFLAAAPVEALPALDAQTLAALQSWFSAYLLWLTQPQDSGPRLAALARDRKDHHGASWLLQVAAYSLLTAPASTAPAAEETSITALRHRFRTITLRAQISSDGNFPAELRSATPYRDSLFTLDLMAAICHLLSTRFESVWEYALEDGPSMRSAIAWHFPYIADRNAWPNRADSAHFTELPARRVSLLFCARAYLRPEYAALWLKLPADPAEPEILRTLPISQPLLWVSQPPRPRE